MADRQHCANCGKYADSTAKFCPECATPFPELATAPKKRGGLKNWFIGAAVVFVALIVIGALAGDQKDSEQGSVDAVPTSSAAVAADALIATQKEAASQRTAAEATVVASLPPTPSPPPTPVPTPRPPEYRLALVSGTCAPSATGRYMECKGFVRNLSQQTIRNLRVNIIWYDAQGVPQDTDTGYAQYSTLLPGQDSPWSTFDSLNPALKTFSVEFQEGFSGGRVPYRDDRPPR